jgi:hypothetical protein
MQRGGAFMRKRSRLVSVAFSHLALVIGLCALPTVGQSAPPQYPMLNWIPATGFPGGTTATSLIVVGTIPMWPGSDTISSTMATYDFSMVGKDPAIKGTGQTTITTKIIPIRFTSTSTTPPTLFDAENNDACSPRRTPTLNMVQQSPVFFKSGRLPGTLSAVGLGQFVSLFQRANFSTFTAKGGVSPDYHITLMQSLDNTEEKSKHTIVIETTLAGVVQTDPTWCTAVGKIDVNLWDSYLRTTIFPQLPRAIGPGALPVFLFSNVVMYDGDPVTGCCILSYHGAFPSALPGAPFGKMQSYIVANYDSTAGKGFPGAFPTAPDIAALANAVAGWMDNPTTLNPTPNWPGTINGVGPCQSILEVADPAGLSGSLTPITMHNNDVYHVQDLAFKSWFYADGFGVVNTTPNTSVGGYSLFGTVPFNTTPNNVTTCP